MTTVLVVEDDVSMRQMLRWVLEDEGYEVTEAADGAAGLAALQASPFPLVVLLDHRLPAMKRCDLLELVKNDQTLQRHAYIYFTAASPSVLRNECGDIPSEVGSEVMYKPFHLDRLLQAVSDAAARLAAAA